MSDTGEDERKKGWQEEAVTEGPAPERPDADKERAVFEEAARPKKLASLGTRIISGAIYVALNVGALLVGPKTTALLMSITAIITCWEFYQLMRADAKLPNQPVGLLFAAALPFIALSNPVYLIAVIFVMLLVLGIWYVMNLRVRLTDIAITIFGVLYTSLMLCTIVLIRKANVPASGTTLLTLAVMVSVWVNDSFAYLVGSRFGRHRMVPKISPKKSWEGFFGGILGSVLVWALMPLFFPEAGMGWGVTLMTGLCCGVTGVVGDLMESRIKRGAGVKDSGTIMPGHGGLLDRSDSMLFVSVTAYFILRLTGVIA